MGRNGKPKGRPRGGTGPKGNGRIDPPGGMVNPALYRSALAHLQNGRYPDADRDCGALLAANPGNTDLLQLAGLIAREQGELDKALALFGRGVDLSPEDPFLQDHLGVVYQRLKRFPEAEACFGKALVLKSEVLLFRIHAGECLQEEGRYPEAVAAFRRALVLEPGSAKGLCGLGECLWKAGDIAGALEALKEAVRLWPDMAEPHNNLAVVLREMGAVDEAVLHLERATALCPGNAVTRFNLGDCLRLAGSDAAAVESWRKCLTLSPGWTAPLLNLGTLYRKQGRISDALACFNDMLRKDPCSDTALMSLGNTCKDLGEHEKSLDYYRRALAASPDSPKTHSNLLLALHYRHERPETLFEAHREWARLHDPGTDAFSFDRSRDPARKIRVGYVSADFRLHSVSYFMEPVFSAHNRDAVEVWGYSTHPREDAVTRRLQRLSDQWCHVDKMSDAELAAKIHEDRIDILVDLGGHTGDNRLLVFARKPAPIQVSYLGYPDTTGLLAMDYRITDAVADPIGISESYYTETLVRFSQGFLCYRPFAALPVDKPFRKEVVFGSFNYSAKISPETVAAWAGILSRVPGAGLCLKAKAFADLAAMAAFRDRFEALGIASGRIEFLPQDPDVRDHLARYNGIDIALDTFPYNGTTTTCEALWMGTPVVTLTGNVHAARVGASILHRVGLQDLVAKDVVEYVEKAVALAEDRERLTSLHNSIREKMLASPLVDANIFTSILEGAYRWMWQKWCSEKEETVMQDHVKKAETLVSEGERLFEQGDIQGAERAFNESIEVDPANVTAYNNLGVLWWHEGQVDKAMAFIGRALAVNPEDEIALSNMKAIREAAFENQPTQPPVPATGERSAEEEKEDLLKRINAFPFWYHKIELPHGIVTPGWAPLDASAYGIPQTLAGKRVLDIGAWDGFWTFEALKRGAREVVAIDDFSDYLGSLAKRDRKAWETFDLCRSALGYSEDVCKRFEVSVYDITESMLGAFDVVFFFGTLYHLRYPLLALDRISSVCREEIYVESAICDDFSPYRGGLGKGYAGDQMVMEFYPGKEYGNNDTNWWCPTLHCLKHMVGAAGFENVEAWKLKQSPQKLPFCRGFAKGKKG